MTDQQRDARFVTVWNGTSYLLPDYDGRTTLSDLVERPITRTKLISAPPKKFSPETKAFAVELYLVGQPISAIAKRLHTSPGRISMWVKQRTIRTDAGARVGGPSIPERRPGVPPEGRDRSPMPCAPLIQKES